MAEPTIHDKAMPTIPNGTNGNGPTQTPDSATENETTTMAPGLSADEIALYDRQIRLWGAQAQERIRSANILLVSLRALGTEIAKNLTLAGIRSLTIIDDDPVTEEDLGAGYFLREEDIGKPRAEAAIPRIRELNPRVTVTSDGSLATLLTKPPQYYTPFTLILATDHPFPTLSALNTTARFAGRPFYAAQTHGLYGFIFADLVQHTYTLTRSASNIPPTPGTPETLTRSIIACTTKRDPSGSVTETVTKRELYCPLILANTSPLPPSLLHNRRKLRTISPLLPCLRALFEFQNLSTHPSPSATSATDLATFTSLATTKSRELQLPPETLKADFLRSFIQSIGAEVVTTAAFVGGRLSEDVINVLGGREQPIQNFAVFDGEALQGPMYCLYSPPPEMAMIGGMGGGDGLQMGGEVGMQGLGGAGVGFGNGGGMGGMGMAAAMGNGGGMDLAAAMRKGGGMGNGGATGMPAAMGNSGGTGNGAITSNGADTTHNANLDNGIATDGGAGTLAGNGGGSLPQA